MLRDGKQPGRTGMQNSLSLSTTAKPTSASSAAASSAAAITKQPSDDEPRHSDSHSGETSPLQKNIKMKTENLLKKAIGLLETAVNSRDLEAHRLSAIQALNEQLPEEIETSEKQRQVAERTRNISLNALNYEMTKLKVEDKDNKTSTFFRIIYDNLPQPITPDGVLSTLKNIQLSLAPQKVSNPADTSQSTLTSSILSHSGTTAAASTTSSSAAAATLRASSSSPAFPPPPSSSVDAGGTPDDADDFVMGDEDFRAPLEVIEQPQSQQQPLQLQQPPQPQLPPVAQPSVLLTLPPMSTTFKEQFVSFLQRLQARIEHSKQQADHTNIFLDMITQEFVHLRGDNEATINETALVTKPWERMAEGRVQRVADHDGILGKVFSGFAGRVTEWYKKIPKMLTTEQMSDRNAIANYTSEETAEDSQSIRMQRIRSVNGFEPRSAQLRDMAVVQDLERRVKKSHGSEGLRKQHHELEEHLRVEMQELGLRPISNSRQPVIVAARNLFSGTTTYANNYVERKEAAKKELNPLFERHVKIGKLKGYKTGKTIAVNQNTSVSAETGDAQVDELSTLLETKLQIGRFGVK